MLPKQIQSLWTATTPETKYPQLESEVAADVAIIGAGIAGLNAGYFLLRAGLKVVIIDSQHIATGTSGNTTAKITSQHFLRYALLKEKFGSEKAKTYADSNQWAVSEAKLIIKKENIDCDFIKLPAHVYSQTEEGRLKIKKETEAAKELGLPASFLIDSDIPFSITGAIRFENQACFHPRKYLLALAEIIKANGGLIFEKTPALNIIEKENYSVVTPTYNIKATYVIIATNFPFDDKTETCKSLHLSPSYVLAAKLNYPAPKGMFIAMDGNKLSFRPHRSDGEEWFLIGDSSEAGIESTDRFARLEKTARENFDIRSIDYKWAAEDTITQDGVSCIGKIPKTKSIFVTTGYNKWGMTLSFVSAKILTDLITGKPNSWADFYNPVRLAKDTDIHTSKTSATSQLESAIEREASDLAPETGKVVSHKNQNIAVYKDANGRLHARSAICTHLGCTVDWNSTDKTWDCPCHGSRFNRNGQVINGPAEKPLQEIKIDSD